MKFGAMIYQSTGTISAVEFARIAEQCGCDSVWLGEHTHRPVTGDERPLLRQGKLHNHAFMQDPWVTLGAIAASTRNLILGTAVTLLTHRDPIILAKEVATLDNLSGGRVILGVGFGHPQEPYRTEMTNHGIKPSDRFDVVRERVLAMREMWTKEEAEFHGLHVNFDPIWLFPKPIQSGGVPVLLGSSGGSTREIWEKRLAWMLEYCDGWLPGSTEPHLADRIHELQAAARRSGRPAYDVTIHWSEARGTVDPLDESTIEQFESIGVNRIIRHFTPMPSDSQFYPREAVLASLKEYEKLLCKLV
jgi:probable F420-dependent oxidoreductase